LKTTTARATLVSVYLVFLAIQLLLFFVLVGRQELASSEAWLLIKSLLLSYSVPLTVITAGVFSNLRNSRNQTNSFPFWLAFALSCLWNLFLAIPTVIYVRAADTTPDIVKSSYEMSQTANFLVAGALTYFFAEAK